MALREELERSGAWLFRIRSWVPPILILPLALVARRADASDRPGLDPSLAIAGLAVAFVGLLIRAHVVGHAPAGTSGKGRSLRGDHPLTTTGLYSVVRHPLYLANYFLWLGPAVAAGRWWCPVAMTVAFWLYYERIMFAEEEHLRRSLGEEFLGWAAVTPAFIPNPRLWRPPALSFSFKTVLRQEYYAFYSVIALFVLLEIATASLETGRLTVSPIWVAVLAGATILCSPLRYLQRHTKVLDVEDR